MHFYNWQSYLFIIVFSFWSNYYYFFNFHSIAFLPGVVAFTAYCFPRLMTSRFSMSGWERLQVIIIIHSKLEEYSPPNSLCLVRALEVQLRATSLWNLMSVAGLFVVRLVGQSSAGHSFVKVKSLVHRNIPLLNVA